MLVDKRAYNRIVYAVPYLHNNEKCGNHQCGEECNIGHKVGEERAAYERIYKILPEKSRLQGFSAECDIRNVSFKNISILGYAVTNLEEANLLIMDHVNGVSIENNLPLPSVGHVAADIGWAYAPICGPDGIYRGVVRMTFENQSGAPIDCAPRLVISPANTARFSAIPHALSLAPGQSAALEIPVSLPAGRYVLRIQDICPATDSAWQMITLPLKLNVSGTGLGFVNCYGDRLADIRASVSHDELLLSSAVISRKDAHLIVYSAMPAEEFEGEVKFTVEETDFAEAPAILLGKHGLELAPQLRCPAEITYVFKNEPRVKEIRKNVVPFSEDGCARLSFDTLGLEPNAKEFWLEVEAVLPETQKYRYPYTLFHSVKPGEIAHMFGHVEIVG